MRNPNAAESLGLLITARRLLQNPFQAMGWQISKPLNFHSLRPAWPLQGCWDARLSRRIEVT